MHGRMCPRNECCALCPQIMTKIGGTCLITIGVWCTIELAVQFGKYRHVCHLGSEGCPTLTNMLVIIVGGIPIAMPTVLSVTLALGAYKLAKEGAIVARMSAVEEMAGMDILCSDKTGARARSRLYFRVLEAELFRIWVCARLPVCWATHVLLKLLVFS